MAQETSHQDMKALLYAADRTGSKKAVAFFVQQRMPEPLIERLRVGGNDVRVEAVRGLATIGDKTALPALADLLETEREPIGESEDATIHKMLKRAALRAASQLSGESFEVDDINDERAIMAVVERMRAKHGRT